MAQGTPISVAVDDAVKFIVDVLRTPRQSQYSGYGYEIYIPNVLTSYLQENGRDAAHGGQEMLAISGAFCDAAWELCRRGILRPGIRRMNSQSTSDGNAGLGFSVTVFGHAWIRDADKNVFVPVEPERFGQLLEPFAQRFGTGFKQRSQEAIRCYGAHAYLACCAMCGAAAESILLATAIAKEGDSKKVLSAYAGAQGRSRVENMVVGKLNEHLRRNFQALAELLKYWRDTSAHGRATVIADDEAYTSLALLLRHARFVDENWSEMVAKK